MFAAACAAGLTSWGLSDHVRGSTTWLPEYVALVRGFRHEDLEIHVGVEAKLLDRRGRLDLPRQLPQLDYILIADHQFPGPDGPIAPPAVAEAIAEGRWSADSVIQELVTATIAALHSCPAPPIVAHLFSLLPKCGIEERLVSDATVDALAEACSATDAAVEVNEKWRCPSPRVVARLAGAGVRLLGGSDAHRAEDVGRWSYASALAEVVADVAAGVGR